ncbi:MAG: tape measure protein [Pseudomonadota bacterium]
MTRSTTAIFRANGSSFIQEMGRMTASTQRLERGVSDNFRKVERQLAALRAAAVNVFGGIGAGLAVRELGRASEASTRITNALRAAGINADEFRGKLLKAALEARTPVEALANSLLRLEKIRPLDGTDTNLERVATLNRLFTAGGGTTAEANSVTTQLAQALQSGVLQGDELRSLREAAPVELLQAIADQAGVTIGELKAAGAEGRLTADAVLAAIDGLSTQSRAMLDATELTVEQASTNVRSAFVEIAGSVDRELGASSSVAQVLNGFAGLMQSGSESAEALTTAIRLLANAAIALAGVRGVTGARNAIEGLNRTLRANVTATQSAIAAARDEISQARIKLDNANRLQRAAHEQNRAARTRERADRAQANAANALADAERNLVAAKTAHTRAQNRLSFSYRAGVASVRAFNAALSFVGGPIGALLLLGSAALTFARNVETAEDRLKNLTERGHELDRLRNDLSDLTSTVSADVQELAKAEQAVNEALRDQDKAAADAARAYRDSVQDRLNENRRLLEVQAAQTADALAAQERALARSIADAALSGDAFSPTRRETRSQGPTAIAVADSPERLAAARAALEIERQALLSERSRTEAQQERLQIIRAILDQEQNVLETSRELTRLQGHLVDQTDVVSQHYERNAVSQKKVAEATAQVNAQLTTTEAELAKVQERHAQIDNLLRVQAELQAALANAQGVEAEQYQEALEAVTAQLDRMGVVTQGTTESLNVMALVTRNVVAEMDEIGIDKNNEARRAAEDLLQRIEDLIDGTATLNGSSLASVVTQFLNLGNAASAALSQIEGAISAAAAANLSMQQRVADLQRQASISDPVALAVEQAGVDFDRRHGTGEGLPDAPRAALEREREEAQRLAAEYVRLQETRRNARRPTGGGGGGGGTSTAARKEENELLQRVDAAIQRAKRSDEERLSPLDQLRQLRETLIETYPEEKARIEGINAALQGLEDQARETWAEGLRDDILGAIKAGEDFDDVLKRIGLSLIELAANKAIENLNAGKGLLGNKGQGGGFLSGIGNFLSNLLFQAKGGVVTKAGAMPLKAYARGGIANSPQLAVFGEGSGAEAYVPLPDGRSIPVTLNLPNLDRLERVGERSGTKVVSVVVNQALNVEGGNMTIEEIEQRLQPRFNQQAQAVVKAVSDLNKDDPTYLT